MMFIDWSLYSVNGFQYEQIFTLDFPKPFPDCFSHLISSLKKTLNNCFAMIVYNYYVITLIFLFFTMQR